MVYMVGQDERREKKRQRMIEKALDHIARLSGCNGAILHIYHADKAPDVVVFGIGDMTKALMATVAQLHREAEPHKRKGGDRADETQA